MTDAGFVPGPEDRVLLLAPHPDDEALAAGGLLQLASRSGAAIRVLYITRGENNPWAQRVGERRWRVGGMDRVRWGETRWREALAALSCLGVPGDCASCLSFPDQGLSDLLLAGDRSLVGALAGEITSWRPTLVLAPAIWDAHPDHSALALYTRLALAVADGPAPPVLQYVVHRRTEPARAGCVRVLLDVSMRSSKRQAILRHRSQVALRRGFLLRFVRPEERFTPLEPGAPEDLRHPIRSARIGTGVLSLEIARPVPAGLGRPELAILFLPSEGDGVETGREGGLPPEGDSGWAALRVQLRIRARRALVRPRSAPGVVEVLPIRMGPRSIRVDVPLPRSLLRETRPAVFANVVRPAMRRLGFFDAVGWRTLRAPAPAREGRVRQPWGPVPEEEGAQKSANLLAGVVAAQGFEPRTKGL